MKALFLILIVSVFYTQTNAQNCYSGWLYSKPVSVNHSAPTPLFQFQVKIEVNTAALISAGKMQPNGNDIRFVSASQCCKNIPFFVEAGINTPNTIIWLRADSLPPNASSTYLMYYGNDTATSQSNPMSVFDWYEGFNQIGSRFTLACPGGNANEVSLGGKHTFSWQQYGVWTSDSMFSFNKSEIAEAKVDTFTGSNAGLYWIKTGEKQGYGLQHNGNAFSITGTELSDTGYCEEQLPLGATVNPAMAKIWSVAWANNGLQQATVGGLPPLNSNDTSISKNQPLKLCIGGTGNGTGTFVLDWIRVRKWLNPPPVFVVGIEGPNPQPDFLGADQTICFGEMVTFDASGNGLPYYSWSTSSADPAITVGNAGLYNITSYLHNCLVFDYVSVFVNPLPDVQAIAYPSEVCSGDTSQLTVSGAESYIWLPSNSTSDTIILAPENTALVLVTGTDSNACSSTDTILLSVATPEINLPDTLPACGTALIDAGNPGSAFLWSNGSSNQTLAVTIPGTYWVEVTDLVWGCKNSDTVMVNLFAKPTAELILPVDTFCSDATAITLTGGLPLGGFYYGNGVNGNMFVPSNTNIGADTLYYVYTDANLCRDTAGATVFTEICLSVIENATEQVNVYPNPIKTGARLFFEHLPAHATIKLTDVQGRVVSTISSPSTYISPMDFLPGIYLLEITFDRQSQVLKLVIEN